MDKFIRTTVRLTPELDEACKKAKKDGFVLSVFVRQQLERYFDGDPEFLKNQLDDVDGDLKHLSAYRKNITEKYERAVELQDQRKERLQSDKPEIMTYRKKTPSKKGASDGKTT